MKYSGQAYCTHTLIASTHPRWRCPNSDIRIGEEEATFITVALDTQFI